MSKFPIWANSWSAGSSVNLSATGKPPDRPPRLKEVLRRDIEEFPLGASNKAGLTKKAMIFASLWESTPTELDWSFLIFSLESMAFLKSTLTFERPFVRSASCVSERISFSVYTKTSYLPLEVSKRVNFRLWSSNFSSFLSLRRSVSTNRMLSLSSLFSSSILR